MEHITCWEFKRCGRQPGGALSQELGVCPAAALTQTECWLIAGTQCDGEVQRTVTEKFETCIICEYYNKMQEYNTKRPRARFYLFGQYLRSQGLITDDQIIQARSLQLRQNQKIGIIARKRGMLTDGQIQRILIVQEETLRKFGDLAIELGFLSEEQVNSLVIEQEDNYLFFGEALVQLGVISQDQMFSQLKAYNAIKIQKQLEQQKQRSQLSGNMKLPSDLQEES